MKLLVLGSSNEIGPTSFVNYLRLVPGIEIANRSMGASTSTAGLHAALAEDASGFDHALIDYEINDEGAVRARTQTVDETSRVLRSLIFTLRAHRCTPVLTVMPTTHGRDRPSRAETLHLEICREEGVHVFNAADLFRRALRQGGVWERMLRDPWHLSAAAAPIVAEAFARALGALDASPATSREWRSEVVPARVIPAAELVSPGRRVRRSSNHRSAWHAVLRQGERLTIPAGPGERLMALVINSGAPGAKVAFAGLGTRVVKRLVIYFDKERPDWFISVLVNLTQTVPAGEGGVELEVLPAHAEETEATLHQQRILEGRYGEIEIEGFLIGAAETVQSRCAGVARPGVPCDLDRVIETRDLVARLATLGQGQTSSRGTHHQGPGTS